jgi:hypothetical protein
MNRALPPRDRGHRSADPIRARRFAGTLLGTFGLVLRVQDTGGPDK